MARRFTSSNTAEGTGVAKVDSTIKFGLHIPAPKPVVDEATKAAAQAATERREAEEKAASRVVNEAKKKSEMRRVDHVWRPVPLLCKRFNIPDPYVCVIERAREREKERVWCISPNDPMRLGNCSQCNTFCAGTHSLIRHVLSLVLSLPCHFPSYPRISFHHPPPSRPRALFSHHPFPPLFFFLRYKHSAPSREEEEAGRRAAQSLPHRLNRAFQREILDVIAPPTDVSSQSAANGAPEGEALPMGFGGGKGGQQSRQGGQGGRGGRGGRGGKVALRGSGGKTRLQQRSPRPRI